VAVDDESLGNPPGAVTLNVTGNDSDPNNDLDPSTVEFVDTATPGQRSSLVVTGEGTWTVDAAGNVTFAPQAGFTGPDSDQLHGQFDLTDLVSNQATITIDYVPVATDDTSAGNTTGTPVTVPVLDNDTTGDTVDPATVQIVGTANPGESAGGQRAKALGASIRSTARSPSRRKPATRAIRRRSSTRSTTPKATRPNPATVTVDYNQLPPVAVNDQSLGNPPGAVTLNVTDNDSDPNGDLDWSARWIWIRAYAGIQNTLVVAGEGTWTVDSLGNVTFAPQN
jgi:large repetitive protein